MNRHFYRYIFLCLCLLLCITAFGAGKKKPAMLLRDSSAVSIKTLDAKALEKYADESEFAYTKEVKEKPSAWKRFWGWVWALIAYLIGNTKVGSVLFRYILPGLAILGLIYIILKTAGMDVAGLFRRGPKKTVLPYNESLENIHEIDFDSEIDNAVAQHNYRLAVRLLYLKCLKQLSDKDLIKWQIDKTNSAYYYELSNPVHRDLFGSLTRRFEYVWYGDFGIDEQIFNQINQLFGQFKKQLP